MKRLFLLLTIVLVCCDLASAQVVKDLQYASSATDAYLQERCKLDIYAPEVA